MRLHGVARYGAGFRHTQRACVGTLIYINTGSCARDASSGGKRFIQRIKLDDSMDTSNACREGWSVPRLSFTLEWIRLSEDSVLDAT